MVRALCMVLGAIAGLVIGFSAWFVLSVVALQQTLNGLSGASEAGSDFWSEIAFAPGKARTICVIVGMLLGVVTGLWLARPRRGILEDVKEDHAEGTF